jgi:hypothetical protein
MFARGLGVFDGWATHPGFRVKGAENGGTHKEKNPHRR